MIKNLLNASYEYRSMIFMKLNLLIGYQIMFKMFIESQNLIYNYNLLF